MAGDAHWAADLGNAEIGAMREAAIFGHVCVPTYELPGAGLNLFHSKWPVALPRN